MRLPPVDKKEQGLARLFFIAFAWFLYQLLVVGEYSYHRMNSEFVITAKSNPYKFYFAIAWCGLMSVITFLFGFIAKRK